MIDYSSKLFWRFFWIFFSSDKVLFTLFFIWRLWCFFLKRISSQPYNFVDIYPNPIKLGLEDTLLISSKMMSSDLWLDHVVGPTHLSCIATQGQLAVLFFFSVLGQNLLNAYLSHYNCLLHAGLVKSSQITSQILIFCESSALPCYFWILWLFYCNL